MHRNKAAFTCGVFQSEEKVQKEKVGESIRAPKYALRNWLLIYASSHKTAKVDTVTRSAIGDTNNPATVTGMSIERTKIHLRN